MSRTRSGKVYSTNPVQTPVQTPVLAPVITPKKNPVLERMERLYRGTGVFCNNLSLLQYLISRVRQTKDVNDKLTFCNIAENVIHTVGTDAVGYGSKFRNDTTLLWAISTLISIDKEFSGEKSTKSELLLKNLTRLAHSIITYATDTTEYELRNNSSANAFYWALYGLNKRTLTDTTHRALGGIVHHILRKYAKNGWSVKHLHSQWRKRDGKKYTTRCFLPSSMLEFMTTKCTP